MKDKFYGNFKEEITMNLNSLNLYEKVLNEVACKSMVFGNEYDSVWGKIQS
jgi:hypothetical protein